MFTFLALVTLAFGGLLCLAIVAVVGVGLKLAFHAVLLPLKLLFLPLLLVAIVVKVVFVVAFGAVIVALLITLAIVALLFAAPFVLISALT